MMRSLDARRINGDLDNIIYFTMMVTSTSTASPIQMDETHKNSPIGRYQSSLFRDKAYCQFHPQIHPDNIEKIKLKDGHWEGINKNKLPIHREFKYCPKCFITISK